MAWSLALRGTKINGSDPPLPAVLASYPAEPLLTLFDPSIELASLRPHGRLHLDRRIDSSAIRCGMLLDLGVAEIQIRLEHGAILMEESHLQPGPGPAMYL